ncbi:hypothetical protein Vadar_018109 [Vaccinium darrowii]|uniref:Uncharacterized protein n=1 Tax=Vaccinium darrowii TaxID=229202 RepID=A0ACB7ZJR0_9ERIC|nr:hypothetical protein Vadar_018109 [Vaccinium darrowii]
MVVKTPWYTIFDISDDKNLPHMSSELATDSNLLEITDDRHTSRGDVRDRISDMRSFGKFEKRSISIIHDNTDFRRCCRIRLVVHYQISETDVQYTLSSIQKAVMGVPEENGVKQSSATFYSSIIAYCDMHLNLSMRAGKHP